MANRLIDEQSPYLLQHAHNPVDWYPWGDEAFKRAKIENKPVIVSIGYAACHWCHVMERESFEIAEVAAYMNEHFVCIKVDREEHPGVDQMYMDAIQAISGSGGWPLNVFATPDRVPFYGGTYYPPRPMYGRLSWMQLLQRMQEVWTTQPAEVSAQTEQMLGYLKQVSQQAMVTARVPYDFNTVGQMAEALLKQADTVNGGFGGAPKFPGTMAIGFLLDNYALTGNEAALAQARLSLDKMLFGGIYDQIGGGFARYATDEKWLVPHFEKMLYDNALLVSVLCDAYMLTGDDEYRRVIEETIAFVERELKDPSGIYFSAIDADSEGIEGKFYTWSADEWMQVTGNDEAVTLYFDISPEGNWEHTNIPNVPLGLEAVAERKGKAPEQLREDIDVAKQKLFAARAKRIRPITDDKSLLSWNALMNIALSKAAVALQRTDYLHLAEAHMQRMTECFVSDAGLMHVWKAGKAKIPANLDDYAYLISALLQLASSGGNNGHIVHAAQLNEDVIRLFLHEHGHFFYYTPAGAADIPVRKVETYDGATPSSNAVMAHNLYLLGLCMERTDWAEMAEYMVAQTVPAAARYAYSYGYWCRLAQISAHGGTLVVVSGSDARNGVAAIPGYHPQAYTLTLQKEIFDVPALSGKFSSAIPKYHVCTQSACLPPVSTPEAVLPLIKKSK